MLGQDPGLVSPPTTQQGIAGGMYPVVMPNPVAPPMYLRPLRQPLFDTENIAAAGTVTELAFFQRPTSQSTSNTSTGTFVKGDGDTNLSQAAQLPNPNQFSLFGFIVSPGFDTTLGDFLKLYTPANGGFFEFTFTGNRIYLRLPLSQMPSGLGPQGFSALYGQTAATVSTVVSNGTPSVRNYYAFNLGKYTLTIHSSETFGAKLKWRAAPAPVALTQLQVLLVGILYSAI